MGVLAWVVCGLLAGGLARRAVGAPPRGCLGTVAVGVIGALLAGAAFRFATGDPIGVFDELDVGSVFVAFVGASALLLVLEAASGARGRRGARRGWW
ncbi:MAG: GlsB/YeaQ/YmgE family stress response membrane protein [Acidimicrobiia bacterium]